MPVQSAGLIVATASALGLAATGVVYGEKVLRHLGMACVGTNAVIACYARMEAAGSWSWTWYAVAIVCAWVTCRHVDAVRQATWPRWPRRERRALAKLFARDPWWKPLATWDFWSTSTRTRHTRPTPPYVTPPAPVAWT